MNHILLRNLEFLSRTDIEKELENLKLAAQTTAQTLNEVIDTVAADEQTLISGITLLIADDQTQKQRADSLQAAILSMESSGNVVDQQHADALRGLLAGLEPTLTALTTANTPSDPTPSDPTPSDPTPSDPTTPPDTTDSTTVVTTPVDAQTTDTTNTGTTLPATSAADDALVA